MAYQDAWIRGALTHHGDRACADRYALVRSVVAAYRRPITVWDLGANLGYFGCRLAAECGAVSVMIDPRHALVESCRANALPTTIALTHRLTATDLGELAASEHVDVVLALNVLHHLDDWEAAFAAIRRLGEVVIIETPGREDRGSAHYARSQAILNAFEALQPELLGTAPSHVTPDVQRPLVLFRGTKTHLTAGYAYIGKVRARGPHRPRPHAITSTSDAKTIVYDDGESRPWAPGMNLWNWLQLGGSYPDRSTVQDAVRRAGQGLSGHGDFRPWNLILQGHAVHVIDRGHRRSVDDRHGVTETLRWIAQPESAYVA